MKKTFNPQSGITLIESLIAMFVVVVGLVAIISLVLTILTRARITKEQIVAMTLVREGIEIPRTIRDTNWVRNINCWEGVNSCGLGNGLYALDYRHASSLDGANNLTDSIDDFDFSNENTILKKNDDGFYSHEADGQNTIYRRVVEISDFDESPAVYQAKRIRSKVYWDSRGKNFSVEVETILTNWR